MTYWTRFGIRFKIFVYSPMRHIYWDTEDAHKIQRLLTTHALRSHGEFFVLSRLLREAYGIPKPVVLFLNLHEGLTT